MGCTSAVRREALRNLPSSVVDGTFYTHTIVVDSSYYDSSLKNSDIEVLSLCCRISTQCFCLVSCEVV